jgi:hypothetical protein
VAFSDENILPIIIIAYETDYAFMVDYEERIKVEQLVNYRYPKW